MAKYKVANGIEYGTRRQIRDLLKCSESTLTNYFAAVDFPTILEEGRSKYYPINETLEWVNKKKNEKFTTEQARIDTNRKKAAEAEKAEIELAILKSEYQPVARMEETITAVAASIKTKLESMPIELAPQLVDLEVLQIEKVIDDYIFDLLTELANMKL